MITPGSRYEDAEHVFTQAHLYNEFGIPYLVDDAANYKIEVVSRETTFLVTALASAPVPPQEYYAKDTEGMQWLGYKHLRDPAAWTQIADANPQIWYPLDLPTGSYLKIPTQT